MDISTLPYFTRLAKDFSAHFESTAIRDFFAISPNAPHEQVREIIDARILHDSVIASEQRATVVAEMRRLHESLGITPAVLQNLESLEKHDTLAVVTGQQAGILGGPLYTFYKAFTAIELSKSLKEQFPAFQFVPVFWIETEDHDLDEIASAKVLSADGQLEEVRYVPTAVVEGPDIQWRRQVGPMLIEEQPITSFFERLQSVLMHTDFTPELLEFLRNAYRPARSLAHAFAAMLVHYFGEDGLLVIDANSRELKLLAKDLFRKEIESSPQLSDSIVVTSEKLEELYHAQVKPRALNLFYINNDGERMAIEERTDSSRARSFFLKGSRKSFNLKELLAEANEHAERFSPNVVMRPLYQDTLLPTVAYVAGPGEIAYFAQFKSSYEWAGLPMPIIRPRVTLTLIEERLERVLKKFKISVEDILCEGHGRNLALFDAMIASDLAPKFAGAIENVDGLLESLRAIVTHADPTLDGSLTTLKGKVLTAMRDFEHKTVAAERRRHAATKAQLDKLLAAVLPEGELQERELSLLYFLNKYGPDFLSALKKLLRPIALDFHEHHIIHLLTEEVVPMNGAESRRTSETSERLSAPAN